MSAPSREMELAQLPSTLVPAAFTPMASTNASFDVPVSSPQEKPAQAESPPGPTGKDKIYDLQSDYRI